MTGIQLIIFDFDGVMIESVDVKTWAFAQLFKDEPAQVGAIVRYHKANGGISRMAKIRHIYADILRRPLPEELFERLCGRYAALVVERVKACPFVPGALEFLKAHAGQFDLYVVSGTPHEEIQAIVRDRGLTKFFKGVYGTPRSKGAWVKQILRTSGCGGPQALVVGDALADHEAAVANGTHFVARVSPGDEDIFTGRDITFKLPDLTGLAAVITSINTMANKG